MKSVYPSTLERLWRGRNIWEILAERCCWKAEMQSGVWTQPCSDSALAEHSVKNRCYLCESRSSLGRSHPCCVLCRVFSREILEPAQEMELLAVLCSLFVGRSRSVLPSATREASPWKPSRAAGLFPGPLLCSALRVSPSNGRVVAEICAKHCCDTAFLPGVWAV